MAQSDETRGKDLRCLSHAEIAVRNTASDRLAIELKDSNIYWKQRAKVKDVRDGDSCTAYFHDRCSIRLRKNHIRSITVDGLTATSHEDKMSTLTNFFKARSNPPSNSNSDVDFATLYADHAKVDPTPLLVPFSEAKIQTAIKGMNKLSAPGPDGFGPGFYSATWQLVAPTILALAKDFHAGVADLERINRSYTILIPKRNTRGN